LHVNGRSNGGCASEGRKGKGRDTYAKDGIIERSSREEDQF
jgi:hypothetical protein